MKNTGKCTKCGSSGILRIPGQTGPFGAGNNIPAGSTIFSSVRVARYVCDRCGYSEEWVDEASDLQKLRDKYINVTAA
jgi:predicted nucleic-acid-binding Zn-ribbon protein